VSVIKRKLMMNDDGQVDVAVDDEIPCSADGRQREFFIDNLLVRIHLIIEMLLVDRPCAMGV